MLRMSAIARAHGGNNLLYVVSSSVWIGGLHAFLGRPLIGPLRPPETALHDRSGPMSRFKVM